jgi:hypothetical protein
MSKQTTYQPTRPAKQSEELRRRAEKQQFIVHARRATIISSMLVVVLMVIGPASPVLRQHQTLASPVMYPAIDHILCQNGMQIGSHIHAHVTIYINSNRTLIPARVGIAPGMSCLYWLHTHDTSGIIHIETPKGTHVTLGNFLDIWEHRFQQLGYPGQFSDPTGWLVFINGKSMSSDFRQIPFSSHLLITLAYHSPGVKPDTSFSWNGI